MTIRFFPFSSTPTRGQLRRDDGEMHLSPKAFDILCALVLERPNVVAKPALHQRLWPDTFVAEANLSNLVAEVREALRRTCTHAALSVTVFAPRGSVLRPDDRPGRLR